MEYKNSLILHKLGIILLIFLILLLFTCNNKKDINYKTAIGALNDSIEKHRDNDNLEISKNSSVVMEKEEFIELPTNDNEVKKLQQTVKENKKRLSENGSVTNFKTHTSFDTILNNTPGKTDFNIDNKWIKLSMKLDSTTTNVKMSVRNEYSVVVGNEKNWWLGANKPFAEVKNLNPYTTTETIKTYQVQLPKPSSYSIGVMVGYGIGANLLPTPFIGVGLQYNLIKF